MVVMERDGMRLSSPDDPGDAMTPSLPLSDRTTWTESEFLAFGETPERIELFDGSLHVTPIPLARHQHVVSQLVRVMDAPALEGDRYLAHATAAPGELLELTGPVVATIDPADLLPPR
jgi:hypothetical protein